MADDSRYLVATAPVGRVLRVVIAVAAVAAGLVLHLVGPALQHGVPSQAAAHHPATAEQLITDAGISGPITIEPAAAAHDATECSSLLRPAVAGAIPLPGCAVSAWQPLAVGGLVPAPESADRSVRSVDRLRSPGVQRI